MARKNGRADVSPSQIFGRCGRRRRGNRNSRRQKAQEPRMRHGRVRQASVPAAAQAEMAGNVAASPGTLSGPPGSDFMVDVLKSVDIDFVFSNPASSCRGIHESIVNYGGNKKPEFITCMHEESAVAMSHGYFKVAGKLAGALCHGTVGLQHAAMAVYNAWCDRAGSFIMVGNRMDANTRQPGVPTIHAVQDPGSLIRDFTKWDDNPQSLQHFAESAVRAYKIAMTPPHEPVLIALEEKIQEDAIEKGPRPLVIPKLNMVAPPGGDPNAVREAARLLAMADNPVIVADRVGRTPAGVKNLIALAESLNAPVIDQLGRMNMPNNHPLCNIGAGQLIENSDCILGLELTDFWGTVNEMDDSATADYRQAHQAGHQADQHRRRRSLHPRELSGFRALSARRYSPSARTPKPRLPMLTEYIKQAIPADRRAMIAARGDKAKKGQAAARERTLQGGADNAWDASPSARRASRRKSGRKSATKIGRWCRAIPARRIGRTGCGRSISIINSSADPAAQVSAMACQQRWARRSRIAPLIRRACASTSRTTATPCMRRARYGQRRTTRCRY
jgi:hypothetical protein